VSQRLRTYKTSLRRPRAKRSWRNVRSEIEDRYGPIPETVDNLFQYARLRREASRLGVVSIDREADRLAVKFSERGRHRSGQTDCNGVGRGCKLRSERGLEASIDLRRGCPRSSPKCGGCLRNFVEAGALASRGLRALYRVTGKERLTGNRHAGRDRTSTLDACPATGLCHEDTQTECQTEL